MSKWNSQLTKDITTLASSSQFLWSIALEFSERPTKAATVLSATILASSATSSKEFVLEPIIAATPGEAKAALAHSLLALGIDLCITDSLAGITTNSGGVAITFCILSKISSYPRLQ